VTLDRRQRFDARLAPETQEGIKRLERIAIGIKGQGQVIDWLVAAELDRITGESPEETK
jgi:hypothetical protein